MKCHAQQDQRLDDLPPPPRSHSVRKPKEAAKNEDFVINIFGKYTRQGIFMLFKQLYFYLSIFRFSKNVPI